MINGLSPQQRRISAVLACAHKRPPNSSHLPTMYGLSRWSGGARFSTCQFLRGDALKFDYCGAPTVPDKPYCESHCRVCYVDPKEAKRGAIRVSKKLPRAQQRERFLSNHKNRRLIELRDRGGSHADIAQALAMSRRNVGYLLGRWSELTRA